MKFYPPTIVHVDLKRKFGKLETFSELILLFNGHISTLLTAARLPKFDAAWTEKLEIFLPSHTDFLFIFSQSVRKWQRKWATEKKGVQRPFKRVNCNGYQHYMCLGSSMHDVAWHCALNYVRSNDAQKQLARASFINLLSARARGMTWHILVPRGRDPFGQHQENSGRSQHRKSAIHGLIAKSDKSDWLKIIKKDFSAHAHNLGLARVLDFWCWRKGSRPMGTRMDLAWHFAMNYVRSKDAHKRTCLIQMMLSLKG